MTNLFTAIDLRFRRRLFGLSNKYIVRKINLFERSWKIPVIDYMGYGIAQQHVQEHHIYQQLKKLIQSNTSGAFFDIGTNIGQTLIKVKSLDWDIPYFGFDPNPNCIYYINEMVKLNTLRKVKMYCVGIGAARQMTDFHYAGMDDVCGTFDEIQALNTNVPITVSSPVWPLDDFTFPISPADHIVVKIDVEGFELQVLTGASKFITRYQPAIILELLPHKHIQENKAKTVAVFHLFESWNYEPFLIEPNGERKPLAEVPDNADDFGKVDYLFLPKPTNR